MKPETRRHRIYGILDRLHALKNAGWGEDTCPVYSPPQKCAKGGCVWWDTLKQQCWVQNPRPLKDKAGRG